MGDVSTVFVKKYEAEVQAEFQQQTSLMQSTVRSKPIMNAEAVKFPWMGKVIAGTKARGGLIPTMDADHKSIELTGTEYYAASYVEENDLDRLNFDERREYVKMGAYALGRKTDEVIIDAMKTGQSTDSGNASNPLTMAILSGLIAKMNKADVPDDGQRYCVVGPDQWEQLMAIDQFVKADYVGPEYPLLKNVENRRFRGINFFVSNLLPAGTGTSTICFLYHRLGVGAAVGKRVTAQIDRIPEKDSYLVNNKIRIGAAVVDKTGVIKFSVKD